MKNPGSGSGSAEMKGIKSTVKINYWDKSISGKDVTTKIGKNI